MLFKTLIPDIYQTNTKGNKHLDILNVSRAAKFVNDDSINTIMSEKNRPSYKLSDLVLLIILITVKVMMH